MNSKMLKLKILTLSTLALLNSNLINACDIKGETGFLPENNLYIPVGLKAVGGINETQFNKVMDKMLALYTGTVASHNAKFVIERRWTDGTVNAFAHENTPGVFTIVMFGGLARHQAITEDGMALVACHELGHHLGGAPKKVDQNGTKRWASNEGQADYWGTMKCLRNYFESENNTAAVKSLAVPQDVVKSCSLIYTNDNERALCQRTAMAGLSVGRLFNDLSGESVKVQFNTPDKSTVSVTYNDHPASQCRLDTYFQASLCDHGFSEVVSDSDINVGVCSIRNGDTVGNRPLCWFKPE
jgi:hypothetical protein